MEPAQAGGYCKRELRAGTEPGMGRNDLRNVHSMPAVERQQLLHRLQVLPHTIAFWTGDFGTFCSSDRDAGPEITNGKPDAAKAAAKSSIEIDKAEVQPRGSRDCNASRLGNAVVQALAPELLHAGFFGLE